MRPAAQTVRFQPLRLAVVLEPPLMFAEHTDQTTKHLRGHDIPSKGRPNGRSVLHLLSLHGMRICQAIWLCHMNRPGHPCLAQRPRGYLAATIADDQPPAVATVDAHQDADALPAVHSDEISGLGVSPRRGPAPAPPASAQRRPGPCSSPHVLTEGLAPNLQECKAESIRSHPGRVPHGPRTLMELCLSACSRAALARRPRKRRRRGRALPGLEPLCGVEAAAQSPQRSSSPTAEPNMTA